MPKPRKIFVIFSKTIFFYFWRYTARNATLALAALYQKLNRARRIFKMMKRMLALFLALTGAAWTGEEIPAGALDFMYVNQDSYRFGRPAMEEPLTATGAATIIRLQLEHCDYNVAVTLDAADPEKVRAIRSVLTPWLFDLGARAVWFRELATRKIIGQPAVNPAVNSVAPVIVPPAPAPTLPEQVNTPVKTSAPRPAATDFAPDFAEEGIIVNPQLKVKLRPLGEPAPTAPAPKSLPTASLATESPATKPLAEELDLLDEPAKTEPVKIEPVEPTKIESTKAEPAKIENVAAIPAAEKPAGATPEFSENAPVKTSATALAPATPAPAALVPVPAAPAAPTALPASPLKKDEESAPLPEVIAPALPELPPFAPLDGEKPAPNLDAGLPALPPIN
jgi:hypothetical protein